MPFGSKCIGENTTYLSIIENDKTKMLNMNLTVFPFETKNIVLLIR